MFGVVLLLLNLVVALSGDKIYFQKDLSEETVVPRYRGRETVPYKTDAGFQIYGIEKRLYPATKWVVTSETCEVLKVEVCRGEASGRLRQYFNGENDKGVEMPMTVPFLEEADTAQVLSSGVLDLNSYLYIPHAFHNDTPIPTDPLVHLVDSPDKRYYTKQFGGQSTFLTFMEEWGKLKVFLDIFNLSYVENKFFFAEYDRPWQLWNRRNEVAFLVDTEK